MTKPARRLIILAQFDPAGGLPAHVRIHLAALRPFADQLTLVSNSPLGADRPQAEIICDLVMERPNKGWDFAGWRDALARYDMREFDEVVLTNSSIIGPLRPLEPIFQKMAPRDCDFWGMVKSHHRGTHLQSYFLVFRAPVLVSSAWRSFWACVGNEESKRQVIKTYEVGLTRALAAAGFRFDSYIDNPPFARSIRFVYVDRLKGRLRIPWSVNHVNKTVELHDELIAEGMPYLKASLLWGKDVYRCAPLGDLRSIPGVDYPWTDLQY